MSAYSLGADQSLIIVRLWNWMRFEFELLVAPSFVNDDFAHGFSGAFQPCRLILSFRLWSRPELDRIALTPAQDYDRLGSQAGGTGQVSAAD